MFRFAIELTTQQKPISLKKNQILRIGLLLIKKKNSMNSAEYIIAIGN